MSIRAIQTVVGKAVISESFRAGLLNGQRAELLREFDLEPREAAALLAIRAETLTDFAAQVEQLAGSHSAEPSSLQFGQGRKPGGARAFGPGGDRDAAPNAISFPS